MVAGEIKQTNGSETVVMSCSSVWKRKELYKQEKIKFNFFFFFRHFAFGMILVCFFVFKHFFGDNVSLARFHLCLCMDERQKTARIQ